MVIQYVLVILKWQVYSIQHCQFNDVFVAHNKNKRHCLIQQLGLKVDKLGILRCYEQFLNVEVNEDIKYPKLLPRHMRFTYSVYVFINCRGT